ncbi:hypothetical protein L6R49_05330 [Myxococcota bacterium]|nr:hypothetical protein [Myxococcota bacterium]
MRLRTELRLGIGALLAVQALTTLAAVSLLGRMGPAVDVVMQENVVSIEAAEDMLAAIADPGPESTQRYIDGLARARANVTEDAEPALLDVLEARGPDALNGDAEARRDTVKAARALAEVNRDGMAKASVAARWRAFAGAWSAVLLGLTSFGLSLVLTRRLRARIDDPLQELASALEGVQEGCAVRRVEVFEGPEEVRRVSALVNQLLDDRHRPLDARATPTHDPDARAALRIALDTMPGPAVLLSADGRPQVANLAALALNAAELDLARAGAPPWTVIPVGETGARLARILPAEPATPGEQSADP